MKYITILFTFLLLVKSRLTCIILIITRIKVQAGNSKNEISLQLTVLGFLFILIA